MKGLISPPPKVLLADIQHLNQLAYRGDYPLIKISFNCFKNVCDHYQLLPIGSAFGFDCGPKVLSKTPFSIDEISEKRIAIPGEETTAHLLIKKFLPMISKKKFCLYHEVIDLINHGSVDCGVVIHETCFTYSSMQLFEITDLGKLWYQRFQLPLPLGGLAIHHTCPDKENIIKILRQSLAYAHRNFFSIQPFILKYSQEKNPNVIENHIKTYVTEETENLSEVGFKAIETLLEICLEKYLYLPQRLKHT
ncbi:MAG: MqnA/MqnD/SBP family protein [Chlamydiales bacterium]